MAETSNTLEAEIGARIAARRKQMGLTQEQASEKAGLSQQFFACVERGSKNIRAESIIKISRAMNISADYILFGTNSDVDRNYLTEMMEPLNDKQLKCMEEIIRNFLIACGYETD